MEAASDSALWNVRGAAAAMVVCRNEMEEVSHLGCLELDELSF